MLKFRNVRYDSIDAGIVAEIKSEHTQNDDCHDALKSRKTIDNYLINGAQVIMATVNTNPIGYMVTQSGQIEEMYFSAPADKSVQYATIEKAFAKKAQHFKLMVK